MKKLLFLLTLSFAPLAFAQEAGNASPSLSIGADYRLRYVSITERDKTIGDNSYYDSKLQAYLITDLSRDVEATLRVQSITPWGLENSTTSLATRYPDANGHVWVQNAFVRLPRLWNDHATLTFGRQPLQWGDGTILSDDDLGFNAIRAQGRSPFRWLPIDGEAFTAKISEGLRPKGDTDLTGASLGFDRENVRWDIMGLFEKSDGDQAYELGSSSVPFTASSIRRHLYGVRAKANLRDAYLKAEYYLQQGDVNQADGRAIKLDGSGYVLGLGGKQANPKWGRFGALVEYAAGSGDKPSANKDEAFRPTFASRFDGLERKGYGRYFAATLSDAYSPTDPFGTASAINDGLPEGTSGIQSIRFGVEATPWAKWTFQLDVFQFKAQERNSDVATTTETSKDLGKEYDAAIIYRYSGLVTFQATFNQFSPGKAYDEINSQKATWTSGEIQIRF